MASRRAKFQRNRRQKILSSVQFSSLHFTSLTINFASVVLRILVATINFASVQNNTQLDDGHVGTP